ncbi:hypothetical protein Lal_00006101 [Lupinus albus]|nr:hypothetical protein Lal_00006101 [Lupinus albus]
MESGHHGHSDSIKKYEEEAIDLSHEEKKKEPKEIEVQNTSQLHLLSFLRPFKSCSSTMAIINLLRSIKHLLHAS